jgi:hypothetical protein
MILGFHGNDYKQFRLLGCYAVRFLQEPHGATPQETAFFLNHPFVFHSMYIR